jgi:N-acetylglucosamine-6-phosphate deacetylase
MRSIEAARVVLPSGVVGPASVVVDGTDIVEIRERPSIAPDRTLAPGFVDLQVNGIGSVDVATAEGVGWNRLDTQLLEQGVTTWCPTLVTMPLEAYADPLARIAAAARRCSTDAAPCPTIAGAHLEGPFLGGAPGAHPPDLVRPLDREFLDALAPIVRVMTVGAEQPGLMHVAVDLARRGVLVAIGHTTADERAVRRAAHAGARLVTHLYNGMTPMHHRQPGAVGVALTDDRLAVSLIADLVHVHPIALRLAFRAKGRGKVVLVTDAVAWEAETVGGIGVTLDEDTGAPRLPDGTLAGSALRMDAAVGNVVRECGVAMEDAIAAASTTPAALLGLTDRGRIEPGARADLVELDPDFRVTRTWVAGREAFAG